MPRSTALAAALIVAGLLADNYVFLHDVFWDKYGGWALFGWKTYLVAGLGFAAVILGMAMLLTNGRRRGA